VDNLRLVALDFEVMHWGDPSFDTAFLLNHFLLKSFHRPQHHGAFQKLASIYLRILRQQCGEAFADLEAGALVHLPCLLMARIDGKSPVEYLKPHAAKCDAVRHFANGLMQQPANKLEEIFERRGAALAS
jgi:hypothetical protein